MDSDAVNQFIQRAGERTRILGDLDTSIMSDGNDTSGDAENIENQNTSNTTPVKQSDPPSFNPTSAGDSFRAIDDSIRSSPPRSPMKDMNTSESVSPQKNKWSRLSEANREFEVEMPKKKNPAPAAPKKRVSMSGETPAATFFAPRLSGIGSNNSSIVKSESTSTAPKGSSSSFSSVTDSPLNSPAPKTAGTSSKITTSTPNRGAEAGSMNSSLTCSPVTTTTTYSENTSYISVTTENLDESREALFTFGQRIVSKQPQTDVIVEGTEPSGHSLNSSAASNATLSKTSNAADHSVASNTEHHQYNRKVDNLRKMFDNDHDSGSSVKSIDSAPTNFHKSRAMFESPGKAAASGRYESPMTARRDTGVTNVRRYVPTVHVSSKKPASCEIVNGPTFNDSVNYWKNRVRENPCSDDIVDAAVSIFGNVKKREYNPPKKVFFGQGAEVPRISPEPKRSCMLANYQETNNRSTEGLGRISEAPNDERDLEDDRTREENESDSDDGSVLNSSRLSEKKQTQSLVITESFEALPVSSHSESTSGTIPSDSFDYKPSTPVKATTSVSAASAVSSLLDDINNDFTRYKETHPVYDSDNNSSSSGTLKPALAHTLSIYRRTENTPTTVRSMNKDADVMKRLQRRNLATEMIREYTPEEIENKIHTLEMRINSCEAAVVQSRRALEHARLSKNVSGSPEEIECIRMITVHQERQRACAMEIARIRDYSPLAYHYPRANLQFRDISLVLNPIEEIRDDYDIFIVLRYQEEVIVSRSVNITRELYHGERHVNINEHLDIPNVSPDFNISFEVYCIRYRRVEYNDKKSFSLKRIMQSPAPERPAKSTVPDAFTRVGQVILTSKDMRSKTIFFVSRKHPLGECCTMRIGGVPTDADDTKWEGFLSFYHVPADGNGVWDLHYVVVADGYVKLWVYPEDVQKKPPLLSLNIRDMYGPASYSSQTTLGFQYDFSMQLYDAHDQVVTIRLSAAEPEDRTSAIEHINRSFKFNNTWRV
uniref:PH domain-containing protein n=1 Tax=Panagrellus redivivus TaxID=6233 RepID=A0A7E4VYF0_PANRE